MRERVRIPESDPQTRPERDSSDDATPQGRVSNAAASRRLTGDTVHPLAPGFRSRLEAALGADLSRARVHRGPSVDARTDRLSASAFTLGNDIYARSSERGPDEAAVLAHETV